MRASAGAVLACSMAITSTAALACGADIKLMETVSQGGKPPLLRCGREFNEMLNHVSKHEWKAALASYKSHVGNLGKGFSDSADAKAALAWLEKKAQDK